MHIYAFGSVCRGDIDRQSDIDLLAVVSSFDPRFDPALFSIYSYGRLGELWRQGNPFAWHLALESRLLCADDETDFIESLGRPAKYRHSAVDCAKFRLLFLDAVKGMTTSLHSRVFELSTVFLAIRNIATCFSLGRSEPPVFGRDAALRIGRWSLPVEQPAYDILVRARVLSTRGIGPPLSEDDVGVATVFLGRVSEWMDTLIAEVSLE
jgi:Nucleotidyltransferase domain